MANPLFLTNVDFNHNQLLNVRFQLLASAPGSPAEGWAYWDSVLHQFGLYNGTSWVYVGTGSGTVTSVSVVSANGFAGTVATATSTPAITLTTTISGMLKGASSALAAAVAGADYSAGTAALATGILKSTTTTGTLSIAVAGTDYAAATNGTNNQVLTSNGSGGFGTALTNSISIAGTGVGLGGTITQDTITGLSTTGLVKRTGANALASAVSGTDYAPATNGTSGQILTSNAAGGFSTALTLDNDPTMAANSATRVPTQQSVVGYVSALAQGMSIKPAARAATTAALAANTYANGTAGVGATLTGNSNGALAAVDGVTLGQAASQNITACTFVTTTITVTMTSNAGLAVGQAITIAGITGFTTNNPNGNFRVASLVSTTQITYVVDNAPTGSYTSGGTLTAIADLLFVKNEATAANSGLYSLTQQGTAGTPYILTRQVNMDTSAEFTGALIIVESQGTTNKNTVWLQTVNSPNVGTTPLAYTQINLSSDLTNGTGIAAISNNTIAVDTTVVPLKFSQLIGNASLTSIAVTHSLGTKDIIASVRDASTDSIVFCDVVATSTSVATFTFATAPGTNAYRVTIHA